MSQWEKKIADALAGPDWKHDPAYVAATEFANNAKATAAIEYEWVWVYAKELYERLAKINKEIDDKANDIIKYLGGGTGLFTLAVITKIEPASVLPLIWAIPSFILAVASICNAMLIRQPTGIDLPPTVKSAFEYANYFGTEREAKAAFVGRWHVACQQIGFVLTKKACKLRRATWYFYLAIASLILPICAGAWAAIKP